MKKTIMRFSYYLWAGCGTSVLLCALGIIMSYSSFAQKGLLLETRQQAFNYTKNEWKDIATISYSYDQQMRLINKTTRGPELCLDCNNYNQSQLGSITENWKFNAFGLEEYYSEVSTRWIKNEPQNPWTLQTTHIGSRKTIYSSDTLVLDKVLTDEYPAGDWQSYSMYRVMEHNEYNAQKKPVLQIMHRLNKASNYESGTLQKKYYTYEGSLLSYKLETWRDYYKSDTTYSTTSAFTYQYTPAGNPSVITTDYSYNNSPYKSKQLFTYNANEKVVLEEAYYWDFNNNNWAFSYKIVNTYSTSGSLAQSVNTALSGGNFRVVTIDYNEAGKQVQELRELYDPQLTLIAVESLTTTEWYGEQSYQSIYTRPDGIFVYSQTYENTADSKPLIHRFETQRFSLDSSNIETDLFQILFEYDAGNNLIKQRETRVAYNQDSIILGSCCGKQYEAETLFTNRCDGTPLTKTRVQVNYIPDTPGDIEAYPDQTREFYTYSPALCDYNGGEPLSIKVYPNPSTGQVNISSSLLTLPSTRLTLLTSDGHLVRQLQTPVTTNLNIDFTGLAGGLYIIRLENGSEKATERVVMIP